MTSLYVPTNPARWCPATAASTTKNLTRPGKMTGKTSVAGAFVRTPPLAGHRRRATHRAGSTFTSAAAADASSSAMLAHATLTSSPAAAASSTLNAAASTASSLSSSSPLLDGSSLAAAASFEQLDLTLCPYAVHHHLLTLGAIGDDMAMGLFAAAQSADTLVADQLGGGVTPVTFGVILVAGLVTSLSPCTLSVLPLTIGGVLAPTPSDLAPARILKPVRRPVRRFQKPVRLPIRRFHPTPPPPRETLESTMKVNPPVSFGCFQLETR